MFLEALSASVGRISRVRVTALGREESLSSVEDAGIEVVTIDPCSGGVFRGEYVEEIRARWPMARIAVVTDCAEPDAILEALMSGAQSFLLKSEPIETIRAGIELVCRGAAAFSLPVASLVASMAVPQAHMMSLPGLVKRELTPREIEVLQLVARGHNDAEIGGMLDISMRTVQRHISNVLNKTSCRNRSQVIAEVIGKEPSLAARSA